MAEIKEDIDIYFSIGRERRQQVLEGEEWSLLEG